MQKIQKQNSSILINFFFYLVLSILLLYLFFSYIIPQIINIESKKHQTNDLYNAIKLTEKSGISFEEFQNLSKNINKSLYASEVLKNITSDFYGQYLKNDASGLFSDFLNTKRTFLNGAINKTSLTNRDKTLLNILPSYSDSNEGSLTDFKFINYIEALANNFNFKYTDPIGVKNLVLLKDFSLDDNTKSGLETNLYYIPVKLSIVIDKKNLINLLHYIEKVGNITLVENNITLYNDDFLNKNGRKLVLEGYNYNSNQSNIYDYNIYENQMINIEGVKMKNYIDVSEEYRKDTPYLDFIKSTQGTDIMDVDLKLKFFVRGQPNYQLEATVNSILEKYTNLSSQINKKLTDHSLQSSQQLKLKQSNTYLKEILKDMNDIRKDLRNKQILNDVYKRAIVYESALNNIEKLIK